MKKIFYITTFIFVLILLFASSVFMGANVNNLYSADMPSCVKNRNVETAVFILNNRLNGPIYSSSNKNNHFLSNLPSLAFANQIICNFSFGKIFQINRYFLNKLLSLQYTHPIRAP